MGRFVFFALFDRIQLLMRYAILRFDRFGLFFEDPMSDVKEVSSVTETLLTR